VDPVPDPLLLRKFGSAENRTRTSGSVARNPDHYTTEAVQPRCIAMEIIRCHVNVFIESCLPMNVYSDFTIKAFGSHVTICKQMTAVTCTSGLIIVITHANWRKQLLIKSTEFDYQSRIFSSSSDWESWHKRKYLRLTFKRLPVRISTAILTTLTVVFFGSPQSFQTKYVTNVPFHIISKSLFNKLSYHSEQYTLNY
jgi:hypothetical protein